VASFSREVRRRDQDHGAGSARGAVPADLAADPAQQRHGPASSANDEDVAALVRNADQNPPGRPALHVRLHPRISRDLAPHRGERITQAQARHFPRVTQQVAGYLKMRRAVAAGRFPGENRYQIGVMGAG
jgi:hypothetical protein